MTISACDKGVPQPVCASKDVTIEIKVIRNLGAPVYDNAGVYTEEIKETIDINSRIFTVRARDQDEVRSCLIK